MPHLPWGFQGREGAEGFRGTKAEENNAREPGLGHCGPSTHWKQGDVRLARSSLEPREKLPAACLDMALINSLPLGDMTVVLQTVMHSTLLSKGTVALELTYVFRG